MIEALSKVFAAALRGYKPSRDLLVVDFGVFPWHKLLEVSALKVGEEELNHPDEVAGWEDYAFASTSQKTMVAPDELLVWLLEQHETKNSTVAFEAAANAVMSDDVQAALHELPWAGEMRVQLVHPDSGKAYLGGK